MALDEEHFGMPVMADKTKQPRVSRQSASEIGKLTSSINELLDVFKKASADIKAEPTIELGTKMDRLIEQNEEIARSLLLLLELHREHLPKISRHTRLSSEMKLRQPPNRLFNDNFRK